MSDEADDKFTIQMRLNKNKPTKYSNAILWKYFY